MSELPDDKCGYTYPEDSGEIPYPVHENCCYRTVLSDTNRCVWHSKPQDTDKKDIEELQQSRVPKKVREQTSPVGELLDGAKLSGLELNNYISLTQVSLRSADLTNADLADVDLTDANLRQADLSSADLRKADLSDAFLYEVDLTDADLREADLIDALITANLQKADLTDADLDKADLTLTTLWNADLTGATLGNADLSNTNLQKANLAGANLWEADLIDSNLRGADLTETDLNHADLTDANLERATLVGSNLFDADLTRMTPYGARITDVQINDGTTFHANRSEYRSWWQWGLLAPPTRCGYDIELRKPDDNEDEREKLLSKAADTYKQFEELARDNTRTSLQSSMFVLRQDMQRKRHWERGEYLEYLFARVSRSVFKHGESLARTFVWAILVIIGYATVYAQFDLVLDDAGSVMQSPVDALYFSTLTFTTLGLGDFHPDPASGVARALVTTQAALGAILIATFVFVLGRRAAQ